MRGDTWTRLASRIGEKAKRALESGAEWLRIDVVDGLWQFTEWAQRSLLEKLTTIAVLLRAQTAAPLRGVVLSSGALQAQGSFEDDEVWLPDGSGACRRLLPGHRVRETIIVPASEERTPAVEFWNRLYLSEPSWLAWGLAQVAAALPDELTVPV
jgi:hypothetical protein